PRRRILPAARNRQRAERPGALEARPEPDEEAERKREEDAVGRPDARAAQHEPPAARPPLPRLLRVEPPQRRTARPRRLMHADVALERVRPIRAEWRVGGLIVHELGLRRERKPPEVVPAAQVLHRPDAGRAPAARDELIRREQLLRHGAKAVPLMAEQPLPSERFQRAVEHRRARPGPQARSLNRWILPVAVLGSSATKSIQRGH